jgi:hypothetical protein
MAGVSKTVAAGLMTRRDVFARARRLVFSFGRLVTNTLSAPAFSARFPGLLTRVL